MNPAASAAAMTIRFRLFRREVRQRRITHLQQCEAEPLNKIWLNEATASMRQGVNETCRFAAFSALRCGGKTISHEKPGHPGIFMRKCQVVVVAEEMAKKKAA